MLISDEGIKLVYNNGEVIGTIPGNLYLITLGLDFGTDMDYSDVSFDGSSSGNIKGLFIGGSLGSTDSKVIGSDEGIKLGISEGKVIDTILVNVYGITLWIDVGTDLSYLDGSFYVSNDGKLDVHMDLLVVN